MKRRVDYKHTVVPIRYEVYTRNLNIHKNVKAIKSHRLSISAQLSHTPYYILVAGTRYD